jgi:HAMP domain-containing protein
MVAIRGTSLRSQLARTLVGLGLVSVLLLATVNIFVVRGLLDRGAREQLTTLRDLRRDSIELGIDRVTTRVALLGDDAGVASAVVDLSAAYSQLDSDLTDDQLADLEDAYSDVVERYDDAGVERPPVAELLPTSTAGRYVQYEYVATQPAGSRVDTVDAGDGSDYSAAHAEYHGFLRELASNVGASDLVLVDAGTGEVVYSVQKNVDLGTDVESGPYAMAGLGTTWSNLATVAITDAVLGDSEFYLPSSQAPVIHIAASVRSGTEVVGAVIVTMETDVLTTIVTADQQWDDLGLGETGEAYLVGTDLRLRTVPRPWFDDPAAYIERFLANGGDDRTASLIEFTGSPVLFQEVDNAAVRAAIDGGDFIGTVDNYLGQQTLAASTPVDAGDLGWVVVTEQRTGEVREELEEFAISIAILLAVLLPILAIVGVLLARVLARPVRPLVDAAGQIADGHYDADVPDLGPTELGDVGRQLEGVADDLREQEASIAAEEDRITTMLASVLPPALVEAVRQGDRELGDVVDTGSVVAITVRGLPQGGGADGDVMAELVARAAEEFSDLIDRFGMERARMSPEQLIFVSGRGLDHHDATNAARFAVEAAAVVAAVGSEVGLVLTGHAGLGVGLIATGLLGSRQTSFGVWGDCVTRAVTLSRLAAAGEVLADVDVVDELDEDWDAEQARQDRGWGVPDDETFSVSASDAQQTAGQP